jgi:PAS domain S-box-containing protein
MLSRPSGRQSNPLLLIAILLILGIVIVGWIHLRRTQGDAQEAARQQLEAIADLKVSQIAGWREERLNDSIMMARVLYASRMVAKSLHQPDSPATRRIFAEFLQPLRENQESRVVLLDASLNIRFVLPSATSGNLDERVRRAAQQALQSGQVIAVDLHAPTNGDGIYLDFVAPLSPAGTADGGPTLSSGLQPSPANGCAGVLILQVDPRSFLFPHIQSWPTPSRTAETLLVERKGEQVLFLNELRHRKGAAMTMLRPLSDARMPAARALRGDLGTYEGIDYRGAAVVASSRAVPGTPWILISKVDADELYAPVRRESQRIVLMVLALVLASVFCTAWILRRNGMQWMSERLQAEHENRALAARFQYLMLSANDAILILDEQQRIIESNWRAWDQYGWTESELRTKSISDLRSDEARKTLPEMVDKISTDGHAVVETTHLRKDGSIFPVESSIHRAKLDGRLLYLAIIRDITERHRAEAALLESKEILSRFIRHSPIFAYIKTVTSTESRVLWASDNFKAMVGVSGSQMPGLTMQDLFPPEFAAKITADDWDVICSGEVRRLNEELSGHKYITIKYPIVFGGRKLLAGYTVDITDQIRAEDELRRSEEENRLLVEHINAGVVVYGPDTRILQANKHAAALLGLTVDQMMGKVAMDPAWRFVREDETPMPFEEYPVMRVLAEGNPLSNQVVGINRSEGDRIWVLVNAFPELSDNGDLIKVVMTFVDMTDRKHGEAKLREQIAELHRWHGAMIGREARVLDLKLEVNRLLAAAGRPARYAGAEGSPVAADPMDVGRNTQPCNGKS